MQRVPIRVDDRVAHTSFQILGCDRCRQVEVFPHENFALIAPGFRVAMGVFLDALGWHLEP
jgi:hypothetical protein